MARLSSTRRLPSMSCRQACCARSNTRGPGAMPTPSTAMPDEAYLAGDGISLAASDIHERSSRMTLRKSSGEALKRVVWPLAWICLSASG